MTGAEAITAFVALFVVIDPIGLAPIFVALTQGVTAVARRRIAVRACIIGFGLLLLFGLAGESVLGFLGISMAAFRIAGGILLFLTALDMLFERRTKRREDQAAEDGPEDEIWPRAIENISTTTTRQGLSLAWSFSTALLQCQDGCVFGGGSSL